MKRITDQATIVLYCIVPLKLLTVVCPSLLDHMDKIISQDERHTFPVDPKFPLEVTQEMPKVNVEELR